MSVRLRGKLFATLALLMLGSVALAPRPAHASADWCWDDPVISIDGRVVHIQEGVYGDAKLVDANVKVAHVYVYVPDGVDTRVLHVTKEYFKERVHIIESDAPWRRGQPIPIRVDVEFEARADLPATLRVTYPGGIVQDFGTTLGRMSVSFTLR